MHGGTTEDKIVRAVEEAEKCANNNAEHVAHLRAKGVAEQYLHGAKLGTILLFDEANTTDAIDLIKEITCDRTIHGRKIHEDVKVVVACNPYRVWV